MISARAADAIFVALVALAAGMTAIVLVKVLTEVSPATTDPENLSQPETPPRPTLPDLETTDRNADPSMLESQYAEGDQIIETVYGSSPVILPITWGAVIGAVIWRGKVRSKWSKQGYDYDTFRLVAKMRGSPMRQRLLDSLKGCQKNKLQLAKELGVDWKTIDNHISMLLEARLVEERNVVGTTRYYSLTESGQRVLALLATSEDKGSGMSGDANN